jgi:hypothetical protein
MFIHTVYFWMTDGASEAAKQKLVSDCYRFLKAIPTVKHLWAGPPAMTPREVVDNSYQVGLTVVLEDEAGHDIYQKHELHMEFIAENKAHWRRVQVYDFKS